MNIERFISQSEGVWRSMRSGHSLAFQQFEEVTSEIQIRSLPLEDVRVETLLDIYKEKNLLPISPFEIKWSSNSDWEEQNDSLISSGKSIMIPLPKSSSEGLMIRSLGYIEAQKALSHYSFLSDGTFLLSTQYDQTIAEERIWFASENVRFRASVIKTLGSGGIMQSSFASEVRQLSQSV